MLQENDRIRIVAGVYKGRKGVFKWRAGNISAVVKVDGDTQTTRTIRLKSIKEDVQTASDRLGNDAADCLADLEKIHGNMVEKIRELEEKMANM